MFKALSNCLFKGHLISLKCYKNLQKTIQLYRLLYLSKWIGFYHELLAGRTMLKSLPWTAII